ncbi:MAG: tRNA uridine-5-carboxymethylaminomethyl(34) synthesis enzyme MnmG [Firmicutes bacterium]|nr:tRNA uridine-5-carboxymethylaminomethyl(34) synthesis enzyme MnmG [Bacillota bacterium]
MSDFEFDAIVIGAGHAGIEAGLALSRLNKQTLVLAISLESIGFMACNPSIGGTAKGHLVREIDALGGEMGRAADKTLLQLRMLNSSKGFAVQSLRAQVDKYAYHRYMKSVLEKQPNLHLRQGEAARIEKTENGYKVRTKYLDYYAPAVVFCCGVYLNSKILLGDKIEEKGPSGFMRSEELSQSLTKLGLNLRRFKTGTPARIKKSTINLDVLERQKGEKLDYSFYGLSNKVNYDKTECYLGYTNAKTHEIIAENIGQTPRKLGNTEGIGARYCPSIEDKIERFNREKHQFFLEPEGENTEEMYVQGISTALPPAVQFEMYRSIKGFEGCEIMRDAYAIEYDCVDPLELTPALMLRGSGGLFFAGQINGTSGYEEAAAQGLIAGINAARYLDKKPPFVPTRDNSYIGVMIDDLVTKGTDEPYRMMTSRAEYRLALRQDNADLRLTAAGREIGLVNNARYKKYLKKVGDIEKIQTILDAKIVVSGNNNSNTNNNFDRRKAVDDNVPANEKNSAFKGSLRQYVKKYDVELCDIRAIDCLKGFSTEALREIFIRLRYGGYLERENRLRREQSRLEDMLLPEGVDYAALGGLRIEAIEKLNKIRPRSVGQASRISGVTPADISVLIIRLKSEKP